MSNLADWLSGACDCCRHAKQNRRGLWYCTCHEDDYFPEADWTGEDEAECGSFDWDPDCYDDDDDDDCDDCDSVFCGYDY